MKNIAVFLNIWIWTLLCVANLSQAQLPACRNRDVNDITFDINIGTYLEEQDGVIYLYADVTWTVTNPENATLDGFAVHFLDVETKRNFTIESRSLLPVNTCHSGPDHLWVVTSDRSACDSSDEAPQCSLQTQVEDACLCPQPNCTLFYPPPCRSVLELLGSSYNFHLTVLPTVSRLLYPISTDTAYEFSITPYYRQFANLSPTTKIMESVGECDSEIRQQIAGSTACVKVVWTDMPDYEEYEIVVMLKSGNVTTILQILNTTQSSAEVCGLELCEEYTFAVYGKRLGNLTLLEEPTSYKIAPNITDGSLRPTATTLPIVTTGVPTTPGDPCLVLQCDINARCIDLNDGTARCGCEPGFSGDGITCEDIDECVFAQLCEFFDRCINTIGSYFCDCDFGFQEGGLSCKNGSTTTTTTTNQSTTGPTSSPTPTTTVSTAILPNTSACSDPSRNDCDTNADCIDAEASFICTCREGFTGNGIFCEDLNECAFAQPCEFFERCLNTIGSYSCACEFGFQEDGRSCLNGSTTTTTPTNQSTTGPTSSSTPTATVSTAILPNTSACSDPSRNDCHPAADCIDVEPSFVCTCREGFTGNGIFCEEIIDCTTMGGVCHESATCINTNTSFSCECLEGFTGDGFLCEEIINCETMGVLCHESATCINTNGSFACECLEGFTGDGILCEETSVGDCSSTQTISGFTFPSTQPGLVSYSQERCGESSCPPVQNGTQGTCAEECNQASPECEEGFLCCSNGCGHTCQRGVGETGESIASIRCVLSQNSEAATFDITTLLVRDCTETLEEVTSPPYVNVSSKLEVLQSLTSETDNLSENGVQSITQFFEAVSDTDEQLTENDIKNVVEIASHLSEYYGQDGRNGTASSTDKQSLLESIDVISRKLEGTANNFNSDSNDINIVIQDVSNGSDDVTFVPRFYSGSATVFPIRITIPAAAISQAQSDLDQVGETSTSSVRVVSIGYRSSNLFPTEQTTDWVISSSLGDRNASLERTSLTQPVKIINDQANDSPGKQSVNNFQDKLTKVECVFWDFTQGSWSSDGCSLVSTSPAQCECNHLTNFAVLVSTKDIPADFALSVVTYVGSGLSIICLLCTALFIVLTRRMRRKHPMQIMINLCLCLAIALAFFLFGIEAGVEKAGCAALTVFLHYFLLASWFWMAIYSHTVYRDVVKVMDSYGRQYSILAACAVGYGVPFVIVLLNASIALGHVDANQPDDSFLESSYVARNFCWLRENSLYFGFLLPVGILLLYNIIVFCIVIPKITCRRKQLQSSASRKTVKQNVIVSLVVATTMGLSWVIGYLMLIADEEVYLAAMSWLFAILNSFQGVFIFIFTVVRSEEIQKCFNRNVLNLPSTTEEKSSSTNSTGLSARSPPRSPASNSNRFSNAKNDNEMSATNA